MTGSGLIDFVITLVVLVGVGALFFIAIDKVAPDATLNKIGKIAVGVVLAVVLLLAIKAVLFGGGAAIAGGNIISFAIGVIVLLVVLYLVDLALSWFGESINSTIANAIKYLVFAIALIALLVLADRSFFGGRYVAGPSGLGDTPSILKPERR